MQIGKLVLQEENGLAFSINIQVESLILFDVQFQLRIRKQGATPNVYSEYSRPYCLDLAWLPRGSYQVTMRHSDPGITCGNYSIDLIARSKVKAEPILHGAVTVDTTLADIGEPAIGSSTWKIISLDWDHEVSGAAWHKQHTDWFFRHFDHAARIIISMMLGDSPQLTGKILDVGCGDGITDLGVFLRCQPELLVGIDPFKGFERLPAIAAANHLPEEVLHDPRLQFRAEDGNAIPYSDDYFDVVLSWGSLEHIAGGYDKTLHEIQRVLKPGGLLFVNPGLFYGSEGNHLGEFFSDPFIHLKISNEELRERVLNAQPELMDRSGNNPDPKKFWQWYEELNRITVDDFESKLRAMNFEPWRVALRNNDLVEYTPELQSYSFTQLAINELYLSAFNRK